jgi:galacturan 1,4-alpha-galacturonidase
MLQFLLLPLCLGAQARSLHNSVAAAAAPVIESRNVDVQYAPQPQFQVKIGPKPPFKPMPASTPRDRQCAVKGGTADDSAAVLAAIKSCDGGGRVVFAKDTKYTIGKALDLTKLKQIDLGKSP